MTPSETWEAHSLPRCATGIPLRAQESPAVSARRPQQHSVPDATSRARYLEPGAPWWSFLAASRPSIWVYFARGIVKG